jgi:hypothetical protein
LEAITSRSEELDFLDAAGNEGIWLLSGAMGQVEDPALCPDVPSGARREADDGRHDQGVSERWRIASGTPRIEMGSSVARSCT